MLLFWEKVSITESCWLWTAAKNEKNYGVFGIGKQTDKAHRIAWRDMKGAIPKGLFVLHKCDVPNCVRPTHLFLGTNLDNVKDMLLKGRNSPPPQMAGWNRKEIPPDALAMLGQVSDAEIGRIFSLGKTVIARRRNSLGISPLPSQTIFKTGTQHPRWAKRIGGKFCP